MFTNGTVNDIKILSILSIFLKLTLLRPLAALLSQTWFPRFPESWLAVVQLVNASLKQVLWHQVSSCPWWGRQWVLVKAELVAGKDFVQEAEVWALKWGERLMVKV